MASLADLDERRLEDICDPHVYIEAATCAEHGCVRFEEFAVDHVRAKVDVDDGYETELWVEARRERWSCTCDRWTEERPCLHIAATIVTTWRDLPPEVGGRKDVSKGETEEMADRNPAEANGLDADAASGLDSADPSATDDE
jgi:hypothetical protein